jgi:competence protein ComGC
MQLLMYIIVFILFLFLLIILYNHMENFNQKGTCKCVNYFKRDGGLYIKQKKTKKGLVDIKCDKKVKNGSHFCNKHKNCKKFLNKFTTGDESEYNTNLWGKPYVLSSHNCYTYFLDDIMGTLKKKCETICKKHNKDNCPKKTSQCRKLIPQPGDDYLLKKFGNLNNKSFKYTCLEMEKKIKKDNPVIYNEQLTKKCKKGYYKGVMVTDPGNTFHFYRQNKDGTWSHKPGTLPVTNVDADNLPIYTPFTSNNDYSKPGENDPINYTDFCGYYCIPDNKSADTSAA